MSTNIGTLKQNDTGIFTGRIMTATIAMTIALKAVNSPNPKAPRFEVMGLNREARAWVRVGALFELTASATGEAFLNGRIDDPALAAPLPVACFMQADGSYNVVWSRPQRRPGVPALTMADDSLPPLDGDDSTADSGREHATASDGLGESTAV